jgi:putative nucleotidyltransferase with HDIG domain
VEEAAELERAHEALAAAYDATLEALVAALDLRDTETEYHSWRVAEYALTLARQLRIDGDLLTDLERGSLLHDIGKIGVPDHILRKPGPLDDEEWREMRRHPQLGYQMLAQIDFLKGAVEIVLTHHERWDGTGYPRGLVGEEIPFGSRIFAVADALDAITSRRPYRAARGFGTALAEIAGGSGTQFDPAVVRTAVTVAPADWTAIKDEVETRRRRRRLAHAGRVQGPG